MDLVAVSAELAETERLKAEKARARRERYERSVAGTDKDIAVRRAKYEANSGRDRGHRGEDSSRIPYSDYQFVMWDGEAPTDTGYSLFGSSLGHEICKPNLTTEECFDLLLEAKADNPQTIFFWFGGRYDWDEITRQSIPMQKLARLKNGGSLWWHGYRLTEIEGKTYTIQKGGINVRIFEVSGWFHSSYARALRAYGIGCESCTHRTKLCEQTNCRCRCQCCRIELGKSKRGSDEDFTWKDISFIRKYMRLELALGPFLMDRIRKIVLDAGFSPRSWYGPSALARELLTRNRIKNSMATCPRAVNDAACYAFAGGRFEPFRGGIIEEPITEVDENSAYMYAALSLPNLRNGRWRRGKNYEPDKFAVYHIRYKDVRTPFDVMRPQPLFRRMASGLVCWPRMAEGWYWGPEASLVSSDAGATFVEAWIFDENDASDRPFSFVRDIYRRRLLLQSLADDNPSKEAEMAFKWALAAIYGQLCRVVGWDKRRKLPPETHQLEWAGWITSACRADMYRMAVIAGDNLISIDTDSVTVIGDIKADEGKQLGQWKKTHANGGVFFQSGVYFLRNGNEWSKGKQRGMERRRGTPAVTPEILSAAIRTKQRVRLTPKRRYVTTRMALNGQFAHHGEWREHDGNVLEFGGGGKRYHNNQQCARRCRGNIHVFFPTMRVLTGPNIFDVWSAPHQLPWRTGDSEKLDGKLVTDILWADRDDIDSDDRWLAELIEKAGNGC